MRKTWKRALSYVLSAAMVLTAGAFGSAGNTAKAADIKFTAKLGNAGGFFAEDTKEVSVSDYGEYTIETTAPGGDSPATPSAWCTAYLAGFDTIWGDDDSDTVPDTGAPVASPGAWSVAVNHYGDYTVSGVSMADCDSSGAALAVNTTLESLPADYTLVGKEFRVNDKKYDWSKATLYMDGSRARLSVWNKWETDEKANPISEDIEISAGDKIEATFTVKKLESLFVATLESWNGFFGGNASTQDDWSVPVFDKKPGDYTIKITAPESVGFEGAMDVATNLKEVPTIEKDGYRVVGKEIKIGSASYDWSKAEMYNNNGSILLGVYNALEPDTSKLDGNPIQDFVNKDEIIKKGDVVEFTFSVTDKKAETPVTPSPQPPASDKKVVGPAKGATFTSGNFKFKVTTAATIEGTKKTNGKVSVVGLSKDGKKKTSLSVSSAKSGEASYSVTAVGSKAFKGASKLKKVTLGSAIKSIPTSAFDGCKKLTTVTAKGVKSIGKSAFKNCKALKKITVGKLSTVKKGAFKGCKKKITVAGSSKKANVKKLKKCGYKKFK